MRKLPSLATIMASTCLSAHATKPLHTEAATPISETELLTETAARAEALTECLDQHFKKVETPNQTEAYFKIDGDMVLVMSHPLWLSFHLPMRDHDSVCGRRVDREDYSFSHLFDNHRDGKADSFYRADQNSLETPDALDRSAQDLYENLLEKTLARCQAIQTELVTQDTQNALSQSFRLSVGIDTKCSAFQSNGRFFTAAHCMGKNLPTHLEWVAEQDATGVKSVYRSPSFAVACQTHNYYEDHAELALHPDLTSYLPEYEASHFSGIIGNPFNATWSFENMGTLVETEIQNCDGNSSSYLQNVGAVDGISYGGISGGPYFQNGQVTGINVAVSKDEGVTYVYPLNRVPKCEIGISFENPAQLERCAVTLKPGFVDGNGRMHKAAHIDPASCVTILPTLPHYMSL